MVLRAGAPIREWHHWGRDFAARFLDLEGGSLSQRRFRTSWKVTSLVVWRRTSPRNFAHSARRVARVAEDDCFHVEASAVRRELSKIISCFTSVRNRLVMYYTPTGWRKGFSNLLERENWHDPMSDYSIPLAARNVSALAITRSARTSPRRSNPPNCCAKCSETSRMI